jgi:hypothetical protein
LQCGDSSPDSGVSFYSAVTLRTGPDLFDTVQLQAITLLTRIRAALRIDYRFNPKHSAYFRFFRDQGSNLQPDGVTEPANSIRQVPQNGILALQSILTPTLLNEFKRATTVHIRASSGSLQP